MERQYLLDYINENECEFYRGCFNIIQTPCGSGKTFFCMDVICNPNTKYTLNRCLYVTDTRALADSVRLDYEKKTGMKASQWNWNLNVITYQTFANKIHEQREQNTLLEWIRQYDFIFLDETHQLFEYSKTYDTTRKETSIPYYTAINVLPKIANNTTLICLSATPKPLYEHIFSHGLSELIHDVIPPQDIRKIKTYVTYATQRTLSLHETVYNLNMDDNTKVLLYTPRVNEMRSYEKIFRNKGCSVLLLWSLNNDDHEMTPYQLEARQKLLDTGEFDEQVLIINAGYESGINIEHSPNSEKLTRIVLVGSSDEIKHEQVRGRIRHDIDLLYYTVKLDEVDYCEWSGEENNVELCERLDALVEECEKDPYRLINKQGKQEIADVCNLHIVVNHQTRKIKEWQKLNTQFRVLELPYEIKCESVDRKVNGVRITKIYKIVKY